MAMEERQSVDEATMIASGYGDFPVTVVPHIVIPVSDGTKLAMKVWYPASESLPATFTGVASNIMYHGRPGTSGNPILGGSFPVIMEYLPYRKSDFTIPRDYRRHAWMASHGYVCVRVDMRGCGESEGLYFGEYLHQEQADACDVIQWLVSQDWSNGKVGMYGKSWGGANGLQVACEQPQGLAAVISLYSMHDRYSTDIHWESGCLLGHGMLSWAARMFLWNCTPPSPLLVPTWKEVWHERLENASKSWCTEWLSHQRRDGFWKHASISSDYERLQCPVLAIGGWRDAYSDSVFHMLQHLPCVRGVVGPWSHDWPDVATPGPQIEFLQLCRQWWDCHLKDKTNNGAMDSPKLRVYLQHSALPDPGIKHWAGAWTTHEAWPPQKHADVITLVPFRNGQLRCGETSADDRTQWVEVKHCAASGQWAGQWLSMGDPDGPGDQQIQDAISACWSTEPLDEQVAILGFPRLDALVKIPSGDHACLAVRLCDVHPTGRSTLITYGLLNLTHFRGHEEGQPEKLVPGRTYDVTIEMHACGYVVARGNRIRLGLSPSYWPSMWPSTNKAPVCVLLGTDHPGSDRQTRLRLPVTQLSEDQLKHDPMFNLERKTPSVGPPLPSLIASPPQSNFTQEAGFSFADNVYKRQVEADTGRIVLEEGDVAMEYREKSRQEYTIREDDPLSARVKVDMSLVMCWSRDGKREEVLVETRSDMTSTEADFLLHDTVRVTHNGDQFYSNEWRDTITRSFV